MIGTVGIDNQGLTGLEASEEEILHGSDGEREITRDALGDELERDTIAVAAGGSDLRLTIDAAIQATTERVIHEIGETYDPDGATAIVMDPRTSEVLAMANWPSVDPYALDEAEPEDLQNMATSFTFEPGSTFKAFTVAGALEEGLVKPSTPFGLAPTITVADRTIEEAHPRGPATMTVADILAQSSNVGAVTIGLELNREARATTPSTTGSARFGFGEPTGIDFPGEEQGIVLSPEEYSGSSMGNLPIGQGLAVTPIQMASAYAAIANGGVLRTPKLILEEDGEPVPTDSGERVISEKNAARLREMLEGVLEAGGTASRAGPRATSSRARPEPPRRSWTGPTPRPSTSARSSASPRPRIRASWSRSWSTTRRTAATTAATVAAPAFGEIAKFALPHLGVPPDEQTRPLRLLRRSRHGPQPRIARDGAPRGACGPGRRDRGRRRRRDLGPRVRQPPRRAGRPLLLRARRTGRRARLR